MKQHLSILAALTIAAIPSIYSSSPEAKSLTNIQTRIINGTKAPVNSYPFMTGLISRNSDKISPFCGASYIGKRYVMTASHCVEGSSADKLAVWIGGHDITKPAGGKKVNVAQIYMHEEYGNISTNNDIAILELVEDVTGVTPIKMITPEIEAALKDGHMLTVMGWGNTNANNDEAPKYDDVLNEVNVPLYNRDACKESYTQDGQSGITDQMLCAGFTEGGKDSCQGDSGGPLVFKHNDEWYQAGIVSFGDGCAVANKPGVYTRLSQFNNWLAAKTGGISYQQFNNQGYVEQTYADKASFNIKNVGKSAFSVTAASIKDKNNITSVTVDKNDCLGKTLAFEQSCNIHISIKADQLGEADFSLNIETNHPTNKEIKILSSIIALEPESIDMPDLVGSDAKQLKWYRGGDVKWQAQTTKFSEGQSAIESGVISHDQSSILLGTVSSSSVSQVKIDYLVSSEQDYDFLTVYQNNQIKLQASGTESSEFKELTLDMEKGTNRIAIIYKKDQEETLGDDKAYIDNIRVTAANTAPTIKLKQTSISVDSEKTFTLDASESSDKESNKLTYKWALVGDGSATIKNPSKAITSVTAPKVSKDTQLTFQVTVTDEAGASAQANVTVTVKAPTVTTTKPTKPTAQKKSGGSTGWLLLPLGIIALLRRKPY